MDTVNEFADSCLDCQCKARALKKDRLPISVIPRDPYPFSHLYMDIIGPVFVKAEYNYCLCITLLLIVVRGILFAFHLFCPTAKAVCDCLFQVFSLFGVSTLITFVQGSDVLPSSRVVSSKLKHLSLAQKQCILHCLMNLLMCLWNNLAYASWYA